MLYSIDQQWLQNFPLLTIIQYMDTNKFLSSLSFDLVTLSSVVLPPFSRLKPYKNGYHCYSTKGRYFFKLDSNQVTIQKDY